MRNKILLLLVASCFLMQGCATIYEQHEAFRSRSSNDNGFIIAGTNELYLGDGVVNLPEIKGWIGPPLLQNYISVPTLSTGAVFVTYRHYLSERFALGVTAGFDNEGGDLSYGNKQKNATGIDGNSGYYVLHTYSLAVELLFVYYKNNKFMSYTSVGVGGTYFNDMCTIYPNTPHGYPVPLPSNPYEYNKAFYDMQVTPIGLRLGGKFAGFVEFGFGYKGVVHGGLSLRL